MSGPVRATSANNVDTKGRPLIVGAWYFLCDEEEDLQTGNGPILKWNGEEFVDEDGNESGTHDAGLGNGLQVAGYQFQVLQHCTAAAAAGVTP